MKPLYIDIMKDVKSEDKGEQSMTIDNIKEEIAKSFKFF